MKQFLLFIALVAAFGCRKPSEDEQPLLPSIPGKTHVILEGNITNEEAAAIIAANAGTETQFVSIQNTASLTKVDLSPLIELVELKVVSNKDLVQLTASQLKAVTSKLEISRNEALTTLSLPVLNKLGINNVLSNNRNLKMVTLPVLATTQGTVNINNNTALTSVSFPILKNGGVSLEDNYLVDSFSIPQIASGEINIIETKLTGFSAPLFANGALIIARNSLFTSLTLPELTALSDFTATQNKVLSTLAFPKLKSCHSINVNDNPLLESFSLPLLTTLAGEWAKIVVKGHALKTFGMPELTTSTGDLDISFGGPLSFPKLTSCKNITIGAAGGINLSSLTKADDIKVSGPVDFSSLTTCNALSASGNNFLPKLTSVTTSVILYSDTISLPQLTNTRYLEIGAVRSLSLPLLDSLNHLWVQTPAVSLSFPRLRSVLYNISITNNSSLTSLSFPNLQSFGSFDASLNKFPSTQVNALLAKLVSITPPIVNRTISLNQSLPYNDGISVPRPPAPPTGQGLIDKAILVSRPNKVTTD